MLSEEGVAQRALLPRSQSIPTHAYAVGMLRLRHELTARVMAPLSMTTSSDAITLHARSLRPLEKTRAFGMTPSKRDDT